MQHTQTQSVQGGGGSRQVKFAVVNFAAGKFAEAAGCCVANFADTPRNVAVYRALQARWSLATGANFAEDPRFRGFCVGNFAADSKREVSHTKLTAPEIPPPYLRMGCMAVSAGGGTTSRGGGGESGETENEKMRKSAEKMRKNAEKCGEKQR